MSKDRSYEIMGETVVINEHLHNELNILAARFYEDNGYFVNVPHNFRDSSHPQERKMYQMAVTAYAFNQLTGSLE